jgi:hypothetical protein
MSHARDRRPLPETQSLWDGDSGTTCPVFPFYRHPVFRRLKPVCYGWMPGLLALALVLTRFDLAAHLVLGYLVFLLCVVGLLVAANQHGKLSAAARTLFRQVRGWRFLCPECLQFGPERFACGACGAEVEEFLLHTHGLYLNDCPACHAPVFAGDQPAVQARCLHCRAGVDLRYHQRRVRVFGVLGEQALQELTHWPLVLQHAAAGRYLCADDGAQLTCLVNVEDPPNSVALFDPAHACCSIEALWLSLPEDDLLGLAQRLDRFLRRAQLSPEQCAALPVWAQGSEWSSAARSLLEARFPNVEYGVTKDAVFARCVESATGGLRRPGAPVKVPGA